MGWIHFNGSCSKSGGCPGGLDTYGVGYWPDPVGIEQQINIIDQNYNNDTVSYLPSDNSLGFVKWDGSKYDGETVYFEAVLNDGVSWGRIRNDTDLSSVLSNNTNYTARIKLDTNCYASLYSEAGVQVAASEISASTASACFIKAARLIIIQAGATKITKTVTMIEVGDADSTSETSMTQLQDKKIYLYDNDQFDPEPTAYFEASLKASCGYGSTQYATSSPQTVESVVFGVDYNDWTNPTNATSSNDIRAEVTVGKATEDFSDYLKATNFDFSSIPGSAIIDGIKVRIERHDAGLDNDEIEDIHLYLVKAGTIQDGGDDKAIVDTGWPGTDTYQDYGGPSDLWSLSWELSDITNSGFGAALQIFEDSVPGQGNETARVDHIEITVAYREPAPGCLAQAELYNKSNRTIVAGSSISTGSTDWALVRGTSPLSTNWDTVVDDEYVIRISNDTSGASTYIANAKIILEQIDSGGVIDKVEMVHQYINTKASESAGAWTVQNFNNFYNANNFSGGVFSYYFEATLKNNTSTSAGRLSPGDLGAVGGSFADWTRSSSAGITLVDDTNYDSEIQYADVSTSWLVIRASGLRPVIAPYIIENIIKIEGDIKFD